MIQLPAEIWLLITQFINSDLDFINFTKTCKYFNSMGNSKKLTGTYYLSDICEVIDKYKFTKIINDKFLILSNNFLQHYVLHGIKEHQHCRGLEKIYIPYDIYFSNVYDYGKRGYILSLHPNTNIFKLYAINEMWEFYHGFFVCDSDTRIIEYILVKILGILIFIIFIVGSIFDVPRFLTYFFSNPKIRIIIN